MKFFGDDRLQHRVARRLGICSFAMINILTRRTQHDHNENISCVIFAVHLYKRAPTHSGRVDPHLDDIKPINAALNILTFSKISNFARETMRTLRSLN